MKKNDQWVLVANAACARIFRLESLHKLVEIETFVHPESRLHDLDLVSDKPGRDFDRVGSGSHAFTQRSDPKDQEHLLFAKTLSDYLGKAHENNNFSQLFVIAAPNFLGLLRKTLSPAIANLIKKEIHKDVVHSSTTDILQHITHLE